MKISTGGFYRSSRASGSIEVLARNLTFKDSSNQVTGQLPVVNANIVPIPVSQALGNWPFKSE
jgi:hypothetical protein